jgi:SPP1 family predicted phage head-tail adaptor
LRIGRLAHRVEFLEPVVSHEANGSESIAYEPTFERWAAVEPIKGAEAMRANQPLEVMDTRVLVRWSASAAAISAKWRARFRGVLYDVVSVANTRSAEREIEIMCRSGAISLSSDDGAAVSLYADNYANGYA